MSGFLFFGKNKASKGRKRSARYAGSWYEGDANALRQQLKGYMRAAQTDLESKTIPHQFKDNHPPRDSVLGIISPHAGYAFSGKTAAYAYCSSKRRKIKRVFLLGPSHYVGFAGAALPDEEVFSTPLGDLEVDTEVVRELADFPFFKYMPEVHRKEHSLELQLPLIMQTFGPVKIVPVIIGMLDDETEARLVGEGLRRLIADGDLIVVSSDFCHVGPRYQYQPFRQDLKKNVIKLDEEAFQYIRKRDISGFLSFREKTGATICGFFPCLVLMSLLPADSDGTVVAYSTSQDSIAEDDENSVSYLAASFWREAEPERAWTFGRQQEETEEDHRLNDEDKVALLSVARQTIEAFVSRKKLPELSDRFAEKHPELYKPRGVFVTLFKKSREDVSERKHHDSESRELRGCIGHIWPVRPLVDGVVENAVGACSRDYRFEPVNARELAHLQLEISVLTPLKRIDSYNEIVLGRDGIVMYHKGCQAVFLPHVAEQFGWDLPETLTQLSIKAGCGPNGWRSETRFDVFQAESFEEAL